MNKDKIEELIAASKLNELLHKKDVEESKKKSNVIIIVLAVIGAVAALAAIVYAIYRYFTPDYLDDFDDDYDDIEDDDDDNDDYSYSRSDNISRHTDNNKKQEYSVVKFIVSEAFSFIKIVIFAAIIALLCTNFIIINAEVPSGSMRDTIWEGDRLFGFRLAYKFSEPKRGDVIIFKYPDNESENYVKRVIGLPNEIVQIKEGHVYINGDELDEPYIKEYIYDDGETHTYIVPDGCYFMLGDNRNNSKDSRYWTNTYVKKEKIIAKVLIRYYSGEKGRISFSRIS